MHSQSQLKGLSVTASGSKNLQNPSNIKENTCQSQHVPFSQKKLHKFDRKTASIFILWALSTVSCGAARAFPGGRVALLESQNEEENEKSVRKSKNKMIEIWGKNEESGTLAHPGLWGWLRPWLFLSMGKFPHIFGLRSRVSLSIKHI